MTDDFRPTSAGTPPYLHRRALRKRERSVIKLLRSTRTIDDMKRDEVDLLTPRTKTIRSAVESSIHCASSESISAADCMDITVVTETFPPEVNGVATSLARVVSGLRRAGHRLHVIRPEQPADMRSGPRSERLFTSTGMGSDMLVRGFPIPNYPHLRMGVPCTTRLRRHWLGHRPDVVHIATEGPLGWAALRAARSLDLPVTADFRTNFHRYGAHYGLGWLTRLIRGYLRRFHNRADCTMVPTRALRDELQQAGFLRLDVVGRGIDTELFDPSRRSNALRTSWGARADDLVVLTVGRLAAEKNLDCARAAFESIRACRPNARWMIVGDGPMRHALADGAPGIHFAGTVHGEALAAHYASADLFLFPSRTETFGNVTLEAMASGLTVVAYDEAAAAQLIDSGRNGIVVDQRAIEACGGWGHDPSTTAFIRASLAAALDDNLRARCGAAARTTAIGIGWSEVIECFEAVLRRAIERPIAPTLSAWSAMPPMM